GGVFIPGPAGGAKTGAIVTISDSVITGNRASPLTLIEPTDPPGPPCGDRVCSFALGGGIDSSRALTLIHTRVTDNVAGSTPAEPSIATDASGGGINSHPGATLTLRDSVVSGNAAAVGLPNGQFSDGGGITSGGVLNVHDSIVRNNSSEVEAAVASSFFSGDTEQEANARGLYLPDGSSSSIVGSAIDDNAVTGSNTIGDAQAEAGGIDADGFLVLNDTSISGNHVSATAPSGTLALGIEGGMQVSGRLIAHTGRISGN